MSQLKLNSGEILLLTFSLIKGPHSCHNGTAQVLFAQTAHLRTYSFMFTSKQQAAGNTQLPELINPKPYPILSTSLNSNISFNLAEAPG